MPADQKKSCGIGKISIQRAEFGANEENKKGVVMYKVIFKNPIGKILYDSYITKTGSKMKEIAK